MAEDLTPAEAMTQLERAFRLAQENGYNIIMTGIDANQLGNTDPTAHDAVRAIVHHNRHPQVNTRFDFEERTATNRLAPIIEDQTQRNR